MANCGSVNEGGSEPPVRRIISFELSPKDNDGGDDSNNDQSNEPDLHPLLRVSFFQLISEALSSRTVWSLSGADLGFTQRR